MELVLTRLTGPGYSSHRKNPLAPIFFVVPICICASNDIIGVIGASNDRSVLEKFEESVIQIGDSGKKISDRKKLLNRCYVKKISVKVN